MYIPSDELVNKYKDRLIIPLQGGGYGGPSKGDPGAVEFRTKSGLVIAYGYQRVVIGERGPYVEFDIFNLETQHMTIPLEEEWRLGNPKVFYVEWRTTDPSYVKIYYQMQEVNYADYDLGAYYIDPRDLYVGGKQVLQPESVNFLDLIEEFGI